ncbi:outer membrane protein assembly factor BamB family protein [Calycomorphotria hydatis]|uniref:outer membrane protein assembly factor BamB family protein n=1 Tax=Calycomorphotria hydatis TaxID=2528027 RepID=UPI0018D23F66|nr:PQQ-binding-like beta-propeller repeat protein [Calycomorphotria hydatis]
MKKNSRPTLSLLCCILSAILVGCDATGPSVEANVVPAVSEVPSNSQTTGWPTMFGPTHNSLSYETGINGDWPEEGPPVLWRRPAGKGYSVPVVSGDKGIIFYRAGDEEIVEAFYTATGEAVWQYKRPATFECKWEYSDGPYGSPAVDGGQVFSIGAAGEVAAIDFETGDLLWERNPYKEYEAEDNPFAVGTSPLIDDELVIVNVGGTVKLDDGQGTGIVALNRETGETVWNVTEYGDSYATPMVADVHGQRMLFVLTFSSFVVLNRDDGTVLSEFPYQVKGVDRINAVSPLILGEHVMITGGPGPGAYVFKILPDGQLEKVWNDRRALDSQFNNLVRIGNHVYGFTSNWTRGALFRCVDVRTGEVMWEWDGDVRRGNAIYADGKLILLGAEGRLACLRVNSNEPEVLSVTAEPVLEPRTFTLPALADGRLFLRNEQELVCLDLKSSPSPEPKPKE